MSISAEKIAYLRGLTDGLNLSSETNEGKLLAIVDAIEAVSSEKELLETRIDKMGDYMDELDELVGQIADDVYEEDDGYFADEEDEDKFNYDEDDNAGEIEFDEKDDGQPDDGDEEDETDFDEDDNSEGDVDFFSTVCPYCGAYVAITGDVSTTDEIIPCPTCGKPLFENKAEK